MLIIQSASFSLRIIAAFRTTNTDPQLCTRAAVTGLSTPHAERMIAVKLITSVIVNKKVSFLLTITGALEPHPFVLYEYQKTRNGQHPKEFLKDFHGYCVTDGYQAYHSLDKERDDLTISGCWIHARRGFAEVVKILPKEKQKDSIAYKALQLIQNICHQEDKYKELSPEERLKKRQENTAPVVDAFFEYLKSVEGQVAPKSKTGKAIKYCLN